MADRRPPGLARRAPEKPRKPLDEAAVLSSRLPALAVVLFIIIGIGVVLSILLNYMATARAQKEATETHARLDALEAFIHQTTVKRDNQFSTLDDRITAVVCDLLDGLPAGPLLDPKRQEYGCGPGVDPAALPPEVRANLQQYATGLPLTTDNTWSRSDAYAQPDPRFSATAPRPVAPTPTPAAPAVPSQPPTEAAPTLTAPAPVVPTTDTPVLPYITPGPIVTSLCERLGTCLGGLLDGTNPLDRLGTRPGNR